MSSNGPEIHDRDWAAGGYRGRRQAPPTPSFPPGAFTPDPARPPLAVGSVGPGGQISVDVGGERAPWERALDACKNVIVIVTCLVLLYTIWRGYVAVAALGDALEQVGSTFGGQ